jgi:alkylhydroperoxidase family enzyme
MSSPRIPPIEINGLFGRAVKRFARRKLGKVPEAMGVMWHNLPVLKTMSAMGRKADKTWKACDKNLKSFAHMAVAAQVGCSFCLDFAYFMAHNEGLDAAKAREVPRWRVSEVFTPLERDVLEYAEAMTNTPPTVTDELSARLLELLGPAALVELTAWIGASNQMTRSNVAVGIESEGFSAACELPPVKPEPVIASAS